MKLIYTSLTAASLMAFSSGPLAGQSLLKKAKDAVKKVDDAVHHKHDDKHDKDADAHAKEAKSDEGQGKAGAETPAPATRKDLEAAYSRNDFVPGDKAMFDDDVAGEKLGEFPSQWDLISGSAEVLTMGGEKAIGISGQSNIAPLMKNMKSYLPDVYTLEMDVYNFEHKRITGGNDWYVFDFIGGSNDRSVFYFTFTPGHDDTFFSLRWVWHPPGSEEQRSGEARVNKPCGKFIHMALSFNQRALKIYFDGERIINVPNCAKAAYFNLSTYGNSDGVYFIKNIRMAEGAVPLYDRLMSDGKIVTYGITFDVGKATIRPESMSEINRIAGLMKDNADIKFSVEGHTDSTGTAAGNQTLSEARSKAVMDKLIEMGIPADHLKAAGKGQNSPIADNKTDEGRAKNRRVEFVKI